MDSRKVLIIYNKSTHTKENIILDIKAENYKHYFSFVEWGDTFLEVMILSEEIWCFGDCSEMEEYKTAVKMGKDLWKMG